ncbi:NUDIX hydrolase [Herbiconiux liangxiaofengii]|uniref:NUDIX hydrolase n=1 Tax=Herbiconiux liangxiaofengii TaxID=3342795 RepID=UPI0035B8EAD4
MIADDETVIHVTPDAAWLPPGGRAEVIRRSTPPTPLCVVRLLLRQADRVFCIPRADTGRLDLPLRSVEPDDPGGMLGITSLAEQLTGDGSHLVFVGAVRNVVASPQDGYPWPTPHAHFGVWTSENPPIVEGTWVGITGGSPLRDRHWFPLVR